MTIVVGQSSKKRVGEVDRKFIADVDSYSSIEEGFIEVKMKNKEVLTFEDVEYVKKLPDW